MDWNINIYRGVLTGYNEAFIISGSKKDELIAADPKSAELIRPILRGRDILKYKADFANLWLLNIHNGNRNKNIPRVEITNYPVIKEHLNKYYDKLVKRYDKGDTPYHLRSCIYMDDFYRPKIMYNDINQRLSFCLADEDVFCNNTVYFISDNPHNKYLLACLNSKVIDWYYKTLSVQLGSNAVRMFSIYVEKIPVPKTVTEKSFEFLIDSILKKSSRNEDFSFECDMIDQKLFNLFDLSHEESDYINSLY